MAAISFYIPQKQYLNRIYIFLEDSRFEYPILSVLSCTSEIYTDATVLLLMVGNYEVQRWDNP
jgi:hypothetical protein